MYTIQTSPERKLKLCAIPTCQGKRYDLVHKFPMNNERAQCWIDAIDMPELREMPIDLVRKRYFICSKHFRPQDYKNCESRSLNTTAYPRLQLKIGADAENTEQNASNVENTIDELQVLEFIMPDGGGSADVKETDVDKIDTVPIVKTIEPTSPAQYFVCSAPRNVPILLRRNQKNLQTDGIFGKSPHIQTMAQKQLPVKSSVSHNEAVNDRVVDIIEEKAIPNKYSSPVKRYKAPVSEIPCKKPFLPPIENIEIVGNTANGLYCSADLINLLL